MKPTKGEVESQHHSAEKSTAPNEKRLTTRILTELEPQHFALPDDKPGKAKHLRQQRRELLKELAGYSNRDGSNVRPSIAKLARKLGWSRRTVLKRMVELKRLGFVVDVSVRGFHRATERRIDLQRVAELLGQPIEGELEEATDYVFPMRESEVRRAFALPAEWDSRQVDSFITAAMEAGLAYIMNDRRKQLSAA